MTAGTGSGLQGFDDIGTMLRRSLPQGGGVYKALLQDNVLLNASGNIGLNAAAGDANIQRNALAMAAGDEATASVEVLQLGGSVEDASADSGTFTADVLGNVLGSASGNVGLNVAAGQGNVQFNGVAVASDSLLATAAPSMAQSGRAGTASIGVDGHTRIGDQVRQNALGNLNVNVATGIDNAQANTVTVVGF